jgi:hypothetical protein
LRARFLALGDRYKAKYCQYSSGFNLSPALNSGEFHYLMTDMIFNRLDSSLVLAPFKAPVA